MSATPEFILLQNISESIIHVIKGIEKYKIVTAAKNNIKRNLLFLEVFLFYLNKTKRKLKGIRMY